MAHCLWMVCFGRSFTFFQTTLGGQKSNLNSIFSSLLVSCVFNPQLLQKPWESRLVAGSVATHRLLLHCGISHHRRLCSSKQLWLNLSRGCYNQRLPVRWQPQAPGLSALPEFIAIRACEIAGGCREPWNLSLLQASASWMRGWAQDISF